MLLVQCPSTTHDHHPTGGPGQLLTIEIWSDVVCPFCYIGKRELENALAKFAHRDSVRVLWKSFELDPNAPARSTENTYAMLSRKYGMTHEQAVERTRGVRERAAGLGLHYDFDKTVVGSSFDAHRLLQFAKTKGMGDAMKERLFKAYFTEESTSALPQHCSRSPRRWAWALRKSKPCSRAIRSPLRSAPMKK